MRRILWILGVLRDLLERRGLPAHWLAGVARVDVTGGLAVLLRHYINPFAGNRKGAMMGEGGSREDSLTGNCAMIDWYCCGASTPESRRKSSSVWRFPRERLIEAASAILLRDRWEGSERKEW